MNTITDFNSWLGCIDLSDYNDVYSLYRTVSDLSPWGSFEIKVKNASAGEQYFLTSCECDDVLMLATEKARIAFLRKLVSDNCGDLDMESYYSFHHAMEKDD